MAAAPVLGLPLVRVITCGSVDDGKSTLIGRLLYDAKAVTADQMEALAADSRRIGTQGAALDFALLVDGLSAERDQGITIDVAYRFFASERARFILADCPGHEQYTRNMVTGASTADAAIVLVDARGGVLTQTRRHTILAHLLGIRHVVLAVNKMDLVGHDEAVFARIAADFGAFAATLGLGDVAAIPISGLNGDNITLNSARMGWYQGPTLMEWLEQVEVTGLLEAEGLLEVKGLGAAGGGLRFPVQWVNRPGPDFRGHAGLIVGGHVAPGDDVRVLPSGRQTKVARIVTADGDLPQAVAGQSVTLTLADDIDCARGDVIVAAQDPAQVADQFEATLVWMADDALLPGRAYWLKLGTQTVSATVAVPKYRLNVDDGSHLSARTLELNGIGVAAVTTARPIVFEPYCDNRDMGGFILIDRQSHATVAAGMIHFALRRSQNIHLQASDVSPAMRAAALGQQPAVLWMTGLSGAGKSTIANIVEARLHALGRHTFLLDGDNVRHGLNKDLGFTEADRIENIRRVGEVARLMLDAGLIVITAFISPFRAERAMVRAMVPEGRFVEVFIDTPLADAEARDVKGLYAKARAGALKNFTGIDSPYEPPEAPEIRIDTSALSAEAAADLIIARLLG
ncbi:adenylyl-sulfate kinase [Sandarakinorhabdus sp.]|uniref:adenylyl-sulfate kinase n=1 Tax=Sandarakinorhabdus sp. TaxID=1916663 RepID=UPI00286DB8DB|nr:adenylyl-sulfate kinase [Sandarakinorhabdus sp.]